MAGAAAEVDKHPALRPRFPRRKVIRPGAQLRSTGTFLAAASHLIAA